MMLSGKTTRTVLFHLIAASTSLLCCVVAGRAQSLPNLTARLTVVSLAAPATIRIEGTYSHDVTGWSFRNTYGRLVGLGERIQSLSLMDSNGDALQARRVGPGEFQSERAARRFSYEVALPKPADPVDAAHVSGLNSDYGYLMLGDLLPGLPAPGIRIEFRLPEHWRIASSAQKEIDGSYAVADPANAVFFLGRDQREEHKRIGSMEFSLVSAGEWPFAGAAVTKLAARVIEDHVHHAGYDLKGQAVLMLAPFPGSVGAERWSAETRGSNVVLLLGRHSSRGALLGQLSVVLSHELFHLWVPNALALDGDYDWFFEGFTLYQALCTAVRLGFVSFQEYLNTLSRVYDSYLATPERDRYSLVEAATRRWTTSASVVYDKGMLVAFLYDLKLRSASHGRRSLDDTYHELFRRFPPASARTDANAAIIGLLNSQVGDEQLAKDYVQGSSAINLESVLPSYGITLDVSGGRHRLSIDSAPNKSQLDVLRSLGYRKRRG